MEMTTMARQLRGFAKMGVVAGLLSLCMMAPASYGQTSAEAKASSHAAVAGEPHEITVDVDAAAHPFPHFWEQMYGSGRAILSLRESYRDDLREVKNRTDFAYIRFHGIFLDEVGLYDEDKDGKP